MSGQDQYNEEELVQAIRNRDKQAIELLYDRFGELVYGVVLRIVVNEEISREVVQDVFLRIWNNIHSYSKVKGRLSTWILNITRQRATEYTRSKAYRKQHQNDGSDGSVYEVKKSSSNQSKPDSPPVKKYPDMLRPEQQHLLELIFFKGFTHEEAARELNIPLGTVKTRIRTGLLALRKMLKVE